MAEAFTMFEKFGDACQCLSRQDGDVLLAAICRYGMFGEEPDLPPHLAAIFAMARDDVDNSKGARKRGSKGGRPKPKEAEPEVSGNDEPEVSENVKPEVCEKEKQEVSDNGKPNTRQTKPVQAKEAQGGRRFAPPAREEAESYAAEYAAQKGLDPGGFDAERFIDYYTANGWKVGRNPMRDWKATVRDWVRRDCKPAEGGGRDAYSDL